ncbi:hypothetical protein FRC04_010038 [Tulasnella sp. 424]|nr:hypothetical protein FRC04_010038 [Tulasnella sp. 424]
MAARNQRFGLPFSKHRAQSATVQPVPPATSNDLRRFALGNSTQRAQTAPSMRVGYPTTNSSPLALRTIQGGKDSEMRSSMDPLIKHEVENRIYEVKAEAYIRGLLYMYGDGANQDRDYRLAMDCLEALEKRNWKKDQVIHNLLKDKDLPTYVNGKFPHLRKVSLESDLYTPYIKLLNFVTTFFRRRILNVDQAWQAAVDPNPAKSRLRSQHINQALRRDFFDTNNTPPRFSRFPDEQAELKPDICLILHRGQDAEVPPTSFHWKDIKVPIEVKRQEEIDIHGVAQVARYARAVLMEQFDRKFAFSVTLTPTECRVFHWDTVGSHVTEAIDIHDDPVLFLWVMGRLATMTPTDLGYDDHFSNAGRALSYQNLTTTLTVHDSGVRQFFDHQLPSPGAELSPSECSSASPPLVLELDTSKFLFESRSVLFNRATRVWKGVVVENTNPWTTGASRVVKQNWADDARPNEGYFYQVAKGIRGVAQISRMEECDYTSDYHSRIDDQDVIGLFGPIKVSRKETGHQSSGEGAVGQETTNTEEYRLERVLLRFVFEQEGRLLSQECDSVEVLEAVVQWVDALIALDEVGIIHRDISFGNLLLPLPDDSAEGKQATIIDLGLAHLKTESGDKQLSEQVQEPLGHPAEAGKTTDIRQSDRPHHHVTGTLPFVAHELLSQLRGPTSEGPIKHELHHDVESVIWVVIYLCMWCGGRTVQPWVKDVFKKLCSPDIREVLNEKTNLLIVWPKDLLRIGGRFAALGEFLKDFADYFKKCRDSEEPIKALEVRLLAEKHRDILKQARESAEPDAGAASLPAQPRTPPKILESSGRSTSKRTYSAVESDPLPDVEGEARLQYEAERPETPTKKRRTDAARMLGFSASRGNLA